VIVAFHNGPGHTPYVGPLWNDAGVDWATVEVSRTRPRVGFGSYTGIARRAAILLSMVNNSGLCGCGCGVPTQVASRTSTRYGWIKGEPLAYLRGHAAWKERGPRWLEGPIPVDRPDLGPCWIWQRGLNDQGYALGSFVKYGGKHTTLAGRELFRMHVGPIPDGMELDHLCFTPACVRWEAAPGAPSGHLEVVTPAVNLARRRTSNQKLYNPDLALALVLRAKGMRWRAIAEELGVTHGPLITRLKQYCAVNGLEYPASTSTRPQL
jgi:hypothetical protein